MRSEATQPETAEPPFVSIVVGVRNGGRTIDACIESLLRQEYPSARYEIIAADNDSTDDTAQRIQAYPVRYVFANSSHSAAAARNAGIRQARGEIVAITDGDCVADPAWLRRAVVAFNDSRIGCVAGEILGAPPRTLAQRYAQARRALSQVWAMTEAFKPFAQGANALFRRAALIKLGLFDESLVICEDADVAWRMQDTLGLRVVFAPEAVVYHQHRETVRGLLKQRAGYGFSSVLLYTKHKDTMGPWTMKHSYWDLRALGRKLGRLLRAAGRWLLVWPTRRQESEAVIHAGLDVLSFLWWKFGQLRGSIACRVWHV